MEFLAPQMKQWLKKLAPPIVGAAGGYAYYYFVGCVSGTCPITGNPYISTAYGAVIGLTFLPWTRTRRNKKEG